MSFIFHPIQYAVQRTVNAVVKTPERGARVSGITTDDDLDDPHRSTNVEHENLAFDPERGFKAVYWTTLRVPRSDAEAQRLYNHLRTVAWYADSLPLLSNWLPFNIGIDGIVGLIPYVGDLFGALVGIYMIAIAAIFGIPLRLLGVMLLLVTIDTAVGLVPFIGDAIDVAFKSNLYILHIFEHHLVRSRGKCRAGTFQIVMPPSAVFFKKPSRWARWRSRGTNSQAQPVAAQVTAPTSSSRVSPPSPDATQMHQGPVSREPQLAAELGRDALPQSGTSKDPPGGVRTRSSARPARNVVVDGESMPAMPLALPSEFMARAEIVEERHRRSTSNSSNRHHDERGPLLQGFDNAMDVCNRYDNASKEARVPEQASKNGDISLSDEDDSVGLEEENSESLPFPDVIPSSPGRPRVGTSRSESRSKSQRRARGVSWHADIVGGYSNDDAESARDLSRQRPPSSQSLRGSSSVSARRRRYLLIYSAIFAIAYVTSLDSNTGFLYLNFACSEFGALASFSTVAICQQMIFAIAKPPIAKLSDVFGRAEAFLFALSMYSAGYAIVASANSLQGLVGGIIMQSAGNTGVQVLQSIVIADLTTAKWRGLVISLVNLPYLINFAVAGPLVDFVMARFGWRTGYGMWSLIVPMAAAPLVIVLAVGQKQARSVGLLERPNLSGRGCGSAVYQLASEIDALGLLLFTAAWILLLGPLTLAGHGSGSLPREVAFAVMTVGFILLGIFTWWESRAANPIMPLRFLKNKAVVCICIIGILDFASFYLSWTYISAFVQVVKDWGQTPTGYFATTQNVTSTIIGILIGSLMACTRRFKAFLVAGILVRIVGVGLMIRYRNSHDPTFMLVLCQLLQGIGGGSVAITMQIAAQVCVRHADVAIVTAVELLTTEIGAAMGSATAGLIFSTTLPDRLRMNLPAMSEAEVQEIYGSLSKAVSFPLGSPERTGIIEAWEETMKQLCIVATLILLPTIPLSLMVPDFMLPDSHRRSHHHHHHHHRTLRNSHHASSGSLGASSAAAAAAAKAAETSSPESGPRGRQKASDKHVARLFEQSGRSGVQSAEQGVALLSPDTARGGPLSSPGPPRSKVDEDAARPYEL
ncbi:unnamed protein product [Parajaminaea phylloscopi]